MIIFSKKDIKNEFNSGAYSRGMSYYNQGRVRNIDVREQGDEFVELSGSVLGSFRYEQKITIYTNSWGADFDGECSCPVRYNCKHVVAVLFEYLLYLQQNSQSYQNSISRRLKQHSLYASTDQLDTWLDKFQKAEHGSNTDHLTDERKWIAYILSPGSEPGNIAVNIFHSGYKINGGYYKPKPLDFSNQLHNIRYHYSPEYFQDIDKEILRRLDLCERKHLYHNDIYLDGPLGWQALQKMLITRRCFWESMDNEPLTRGPKISLELDWKLTQQENLRLYQLTLNTESTGKFALTDPPCLINTTHNQLEEIDTKLTQKQFSQLLATPAIAEKDINQFNLNMIEKRLDHHLPLPIKTPIEELSELSAIPKAVFSMDHDANAPNYYLQLSFIYGDTEVQPLDQTTIVQQKEGKIYRLTRAQDYELKLLQAIVDLGFELKPKINDDGTTSNQLLAAVPEEINYLDEINQWKKFIDIDRWELEQQGWLIETAPDFQLNFIHPDDEWEVDIETENDWFSLKFDIRLGDSEDTKLSLVPIISQLLNEYDIDRLPEEILIEHLPGQFLVLLKEKLQPIIDLMVEMFDSLPIGEDTIKLSNFDALLLNQLDSDESLNLQWSGDLRLKEIGKKLANFDGIKKVAPPKSFKGELRDYQSQGLSWLQFLREFEFSGILADDMGLGKTIQTLVHLQKEKTARRMKSPCLIVAPTSLMSNWKKEASIFTPNLKVHISQGSERHEHFENLEKYDLILTTYPLVGRDFNVLLEINYHYIVLDEAQNIKNPKSKTSKSIKALKSNHKLALSGTPMENHLGELWSIFDFLMPGFLASQKNFTAKYRNPIEKDNNLVMARMLNKRVKPFLLRRSKQLVASELPPKTEIVKTVSFNTSQSLLYETIRLSMEKKIQRAISTKGLNRSHITILDALLKLRQVCCDPQLVKLEQAQKVKHSAKMDLLMTMLPELVEEGRRVLVFSQFTSMLSIIEKALKAENIRYSKLTGSTRKRDEAIETFTSGKVNVFLISLKAGGVGLNLTEADTVIHYDPWWNPAVENQASDRAHRIGQDKPVFIYKLVVENTLEEKILEMQARKQALADGVYGDKSAKDATKLTAKDLQELLGLASSPT